MNIIDITSLHDTERQVEVHDDSDRRLFRGAASEARERFPEAFSHV